MSVSKGSLLSAVYCFHFIQRKCKYEILEVLMTQLSLRRQGLELTAIVETLNSVEKECLIATQVVKSHCGSPVRKGLLLFLRRVVYSVFWLVWS